MHKFVFNTYVHRVPTQTRKDMLNYKSLDCYQNFVKGSVRNVLVKEVADKRVVIEKVNAVANLLVLGSKCFFLYYG